MLNQRKQIIVLLTVVLLATLACNALLPQTGQDAEPVESLEAIRTEAPAVLPQTEDDVPRVTVEEARAALDSGQAVIVDVRSTASYEAGHIPGAVSIPLNEIEGDPTVVNLPPDEWIITYCT